MSYPWLRLYAEIANDPKFRTISKVCGHPISWVLSTYIHVLCIASNATERGRTQGLSCEDIASALDLEVQHVTEIIAAMQGRVLDGDRVSGWDKRQPKREDNSAERARAYRAAKKSEAEQGRTQPNATEQDRTLDKIRQDKKRKNTGANAPTPAGVPDAVWADFLKIRKAKRAPITETALERIRTQAKLAGMTLGDALETCCARGWQGFEASWLQAGSMIPGRGRSEQPSPGEDRDSKAAVEAEARAKGLPAWNGMEQWPVYLARVRADVVAAAA
jgi:hypothetical protein